MNPVQIFIMKLQARLVADWRVAYKWLSVQISAVMAAACGSWPLIPDDTKLKVLSLIHGVDGAAVLAAIGFLGVIAARMKARKAVAQAQVAVVNAQVAASKDTP